MNLKSNDTNKILTQLRNMEKAQSVRLLDVAILGPAMILISQSKNPPQSLKTLLLLTGIGTIIYNGTNYLKIRKELESR